MKEHNNLSDGMVQAVPAPELDAYDEFGDAILAIFKGAARKARLRALDHDGYTTILDGEVVTVRRIKTDK